MFVAKAMLEFLIGDFSNLELTANLAIRFSREEHLPDTFATSPCCVHHEFEPYFHFDTQATKRSKVVIIAQIKAGVDESQKTSVEVAFWAPKKLETLT